jgi:PAS domain S-box-containing protein
MLIDIHGIARKATVGEPALFDGVIDAVPALVCILDTEGRIVRFNPACVELTGRSEEEMLGQPVWAELIPPEQRSAVQEVFRSLHTSQIPSRFRNDWVDREGNRHPVEWSNSVVRDEVGATAFVIGTGTDLTRQARTDAAVEALRASEARVSGILAIAADAIISIDEQQRIVIFNEGARDIFGWSAEEVIGQPLDLLIPVRYRNVHSRTHIPAFAAAAVPARLMGDRREIFGLRRNGEEFPAEATISKLAIGGARTFTVVLRDVSSRKRMEASQSFLVNAGSILGSSLDYAAIMREVAQLAIEWTADFCIVEGIAPGGAIQRMEVAHRDPSCTELARRFHDLELDRSLPHLSFEALRSGRSQLVPRLGSKLIDALAQNAEHRELLDALRPVSYMAMPMTARNELLGAIVFVCSTRSFDSEDLLVAEEFARRAAVALDNARLYDEARRAVRVRDEIVTIVAHDLGNPISAIRIGTTLLLKSLESNSDDPARTRLAGIRASTNQMERLIADLLDLRRIETGRLVLERRIHSPAVILDSIRQEFALVADERGVTFDIIPDATLPSSVETDPDRLTQVLENLIANALKFTPAGGRVGVRAFANPGDEVVFEVRDTGHGIAPDHLPHLFERYWQAEPSTRRSVGLGLFIARGIVEAHGGRIWAESEPGHGATLSFAIPALAIQSVPATFWLSEERGPGRPDQ